VLGERLRVGLGTEFVQQYRRALDLREEKRDCARRQLGHPRTISPASARNNEITPAIKQARGATIRHERPPTRLRKRNGGLAVAPVQPVCSHE
jgi:hypothetical protein